MTTIAIFPEVPGSQTSKYVAVSGERQGSGETAGQALDALTAQLGSENQSTLIVVQNMRPDQFFSQAQIERLQELMLRWRSARSEGRPFERENSQELEKLVEAEFQAAISRAGPL